MKKLVIPAVALVALVGCSKFQEPFQDAPKGARNGKPADIIEMPDGFSNVSSKCDGPNRVYVVFHGNHGYGSVSVVKDDPRCSR